MYDSKKTWRVRGSDAYAQGWQEGIGTQWNRQPATPVGAADPSHGGVRRPIGPEPHVRLCVRWPLRAHRTVIIRLDRARGEDTESVLSEKNKTIRLGVKDRSV